MRREEAEAIFEAGREAVVEMLLKLSADFEELSVRVRGQSAAMRELVDRVGELEREVDELERRAGRDSRNSSEPPSQDPPKSRAERRREARAKLKELSKAKRKPGGQPGHEGKHRQMAGPEQLERRTEHLPESCACGHRFDGSEERVDAPVIHQQWELPPIRPLVFQYDLYRLRCPCCGKRRLADCPRGCRGRRSRPGWRRTSPRSRACFASPAVKRAGW